METSSRNVPEVWQRGPVDDVPPLLQPVAHALLQVVEELERHMLGFDSRLLWARPSGVASVGFHLLHIAGVIDRLFTYARGESLSSSQFKELEAEQVVPEHTVEPSELVDNVRRKVEDAITQLKNTLESSLTEPRELGRRKIPTTVLGLLFHAAEHSQRHLGQLLVTARVVASENRG